MVLKKVWRYDQCVQVTRFVSNPFLEGKCKLLRQKNLLYPQGKNKWHKPFKKDFKPNKWLESNIFQRFVLAGNSCLIRIHSFFFSFYKQDTFYFTNSDEYITKCTHLLLNTSCRIYLIIYFSANPYGALTLYQAQIQYLCGESTKVEN